MEADLVVINETTEQLDYDNIYQDIIRETTRILGITDDLELACLFVSQAKIRELNRKYRHLDKVTDVISFALEDSRQYYVSAMPRQLGDIFICIDRAKEQAEDYGHSLEREMAFLFTHGLLHLLGYDHLTKEDEKVMFDLQDQILNNLNIKRGNNV